MASMEIVARNEADAIRKAAEAAGVPETYFEILEEYEPDEEDLLALKEAEGLDELPAPDSAALYLVSRTFQFYLDKAQEWSQGLIERFAPGATAEAVRFRHLIVIRLDVPESSILIGRKGATLDSLQHVVVRAMVTIDEGFPDIMLDVDRYREKKLIRLEREAQRAADRASRTGRPVALTPMKPAERKFIHNITKDMEGIKTESRGKDNERHIVVESTRPATGASRGPRGSGRGGNSGGGNRGGNGGGNSGNSAGGGGNRGGRGGRGGSEPQRPNRGFAGDNGREITERDRQLLYGKMKALEEENEELEFQDELLTNKTSLLPEYVHTENKDDEEDGKLADEIE